MIRIKDYIFNENEIVKIQFDDGSKEMEIDHTNRNRTFIDGTFEDIEWNYGQSNIKDDEYIELSNKYQRLSNRTEELEEENKFLIKQRDNIFRNNGDAARYIIANCISKKTGRISDPDILEIYKLLSGGGEPYINTKR